MLNNIIIILSAALFLFCWCVIIIKIGFNRRAAVITVNAEIIDTYITKNASKIPGELNGTRNVVVFLANGKKLSFEVSDFSYTCYKINTKGTLRYKGKKLISFNGLN